MTTPILRGPLGLDEFAESCARELFKQEPYQFIFPGGCSIQYWPASEIKALNKEFLESLRNGANIYALFIRKSGTGKSWSPVYVGQRKSTGLRERITQHLIKKHVRTGSMLENVKSVVPDGQEIGVSIIKVEPESLRLFVEETIIATYKNELVWNTHG